MRYNYTFRAELYGEAGWEQQGRIEALRARLDMTNGELLIAALDALERERVPRWS